MRRALFSLQNLKKKPVPCEETTWFNTFFPSYEAVLEITRGVGLR